MFKSILQRLDDLEKLVLPPESEAVPQPGAVYTRAKCEHCGRFSTVDVGEKLSACLIAFRDARELALELRESGLLRSDGSGGAIARILFESDSGGPEPT